MHEKLVARREELTGELKAGQEMLAELDAKRAELRQTLLRISGAIQVLTELIEGEGTGAGSELVGQTGAGSQTDRQSVGGSGSLREVDPGGILSAAG